MKNKFKFPRLVDCLLDLKVLVIVFAVIFLIGMLFRVSTLANVKPEVIATYPCATQIKLDEDRDMVTKKSSATCNGQTIDFTSSKLSVEDTKTVETLAKRNIPVNIEMVHTRRYKNVNTYDVSLRLK